MIATQAADLAIQIADKLSELDDLEITPYPRRLEIDNPRQGCISIVSVTQAQTMGKTQEVTWELSVKLDSDSTTDGRWPEEELANLMSVDPDKSIMGKLHANVKDASGNPNKPPFEIEGGVVVWPRIEVLDIVSSVGSEEVYQTLLMGRITARF